MYNNKTKLVSVLGGKTTTACAGRQEVLRCPPYSMTATTSEVHFMCTFTYLLTFSWCECDGDGGKVVTWSINCVAWTTSLQQVSRCLNKHDLIEFSETFGKPSLGSIQHWWTTFFWWLRPECGTIYHRHSRLQRHCLYSNATSKLSYFKLVSTDFTCERNRTLCDFVKCPCNVL